MRSPTKLRPAPWFRPQAHFRAQSRWTPRWPVLDGRVPNLLEVARECQQLLNRSRQFRAEGVRPVQSASGTSQVGPAQGLVVSFLRSRHSPSEDNPPSQSMSWISYSVGRFSGVHRWPVLGVPRGLGRSEFVLMDFNRYFGLVAFRWSGAEARSRRK